MAVVVPAWQPGAALLALVRELAAAGFGALFVVDDGCPGEYAPVLAAVAKIAGVHVLRNASNCGKGRALKTGFAAVLAQLPGMFGVVTADADGQHRAEDVVRVGLALLDASDRLVLGVRALGHDAPLRSRGGNVLTRWVFAGMTGVRLIDTQTGLRGIPMAMLPGMVELEGERYEYEMHMLVWACARQQPLEVPIATVYLDGNRGSHFRPVLDSMRVYAVLLRYGFSSLGRLWDHLLSNA
jgi:hypothetical protein